MVVGSNGVLLCMQDRQARAAITLAPPVMEATHLVEDPNFPISGGLRDTVAVVVEQDSLVLKRRQGNEKELNPYTHSQKNVKI